jgi:hypothetical protein
MAPTAGPPETDEQPADIATEELHPEPFKQEVQQYPDNGIRIVMSKSRTKQTGGP